jgi:hypothetical protein
VDETAVPRATERPCARFAGKRFSMFLFSEQVTRLKADRDVVYSENT